MNEKKIPTILSLLLLIIATGAGVFLISKPNTFFSRADISCQPINEKITNVTNKSFVISWSTQKNCSTSISLTQPIARLVSDIRTGNTARSTHYYLIDNLSPETNYYFDIISEGQLYQNSSYSAQTASTPPSPIPIANLAWGKILTENEDLFPDVIVYLDIPGAAQLSSLTSSQGVWIVSLANSLDALYSDWFYPPSNTVEHITIDAGTTGQISLIGNTDFNNPVPDIIFSLSNPPVLPFEEQNEPINAGKLPQSKDSVQNPNIQFQLQNPKEGESINSLNPEFFGTAPQDSLLEITLESPQTFSAQVEPNTSGDWSWSPPGDLAPGQHTLTVKIINPLSGLSETVTRKFYVYAAQDENPAFESSPSGSIASPTPVPTVISTPTSTPVPTATPVPTNTPTPLARSVKPATDSGLPSPGATLPTFLILLFGFLLFSTGVALVVW